MEYTTVDMDNSSKGELFYRSLIKILTSVSEGGLTFFAPTLAKPTPLSKTENFFYPPEFHDIVEIASCLTSRVNFHINGKQHAIKPGPVNVLLPGDVHSERFYRPNVGYQVFWIQICSNCVGFQISCYEPSRGYFLLGKRIDMECESRDELLELGRRPPLHADRLLQIRFQHKFLGFLLESLPLIRQIPDHQSTHVPYARYLIEQLRHHLDSHYQETVSLPELGRIFHYSPSHLNMLFRKHVGVPILKYILQKRVDLAEHLLRTTNREIKQISYQTGFKDPLYFSRVFRSIKGVAPSDYRK